MDTAAPDPMVPMPGPISCDGSWGPPARDGSRYALLDGDPATCGAVFCYALWLPAGFRDPPHLHSTDARIFIASGALLLGYGDRANFAAALRIEAPAFVRVRAHCVHFDGVDVDTLIFGTATGRWCTRYV